MGRVADPQVTERRRRVVRLWNVGKTYAEIAAVEGISRDDVGHDLEYARGLGMVVRRFSGRPATTRLRNQVVKLWNKGLTQSEIGTALGITRGAAGRFIAEARAMGIPTVTYTTAETAQRQQAAMVRTMGERAYRDMLNARLAAGRLLGPPASARRAAERRQARENESIREASAPE